MDSDLGQCDCCHEPATMVMSDETTEWCANWFRGHYCAHCFIEVEKVMKEEVQKHEQWKERHNIVWSDEARDGAGGYVQAELAK